MELKEKTAVVTGGSRGFGRGIARALAARGARVIALARSRNDLDDLAREVAGVETVRADIADPTAAPRIVQDYDPDILVLNAGALPTLRSLHHQTWASISVNWEVDVKGTFLFLREALLQPLRPGSAVVVMSSGAAVHGSPIAAGYGSAKAAQAMIAAAAAEEAKRRDLGIVFHTLFPGIPSAHTELGRRTVAAIARSQGAPFEAVAGDFDLSPDTVGESVVRVLTDPAFEPRERLWIQPGGLEPFETGVAV